VAFGTFGRDCVGNWGIDLDIVYIAVAVGIVDIMLGKERRRRIHTEEEEEEPIEATLERSLCTGRAHHKKLFFSQ